jgi:hypothetical protein
MSGFALAGVLVLGACSNGTDGGGSSSAADGAAPEATADAAAGGGEARAASLEEPVAAEPLPAATREIVYTANLDVEAVDVEDAADQASRSVERAGGFVFDQVAELEKDREITVTFKVPPAEFDEVVGELSGLGELQTRNVAADDVTGEVVDLEARLATAEASADRLRGLLAGAGSVGELVSVEQALAQREAEVEAISARLRTLDAQVDLATVTLRLTEQPPEDEKKNGGGGIPGFVDGLDTGVGAFVNGARVVATVVGFLLPFVAAAAVVSGLVLLGVRRRRRTAPAG